MLQTRLEAKKTQCDNPLEQDLIQDYLEDLLCASNAQSLPEVTQEIKPECTNLEPNADKQTPQTSKTGLNPIEHELCTAQGIKEIPWQQCNAEQVPLPLEVSKACKEAARMLGLFKPTMSNAAEPTERHKKGIKTSTSGTSNALAVSECQPKLLSGQKDLEDLENEDPITETERMIVENHGVKQGQEAQKTLESVQTAQKGVKHDLSDPHARENEHLEQVEVQGSEHMVMADHGPKKGMAPRLKPQFNPLFFPFAMCLPDFSIPRDYDLKERCNSTPKAHSQTLLTGTESNEKLELDHQKSSTVNTMSTDPIQSELTNPWPDQWRLKELDNDMTDLEDPWPEMEGVDAWNNDPEMEELNPTKSALYATLWGLCGEPRWITELDDAIEPEPEEDPYPLTLQDPDKDQKQTRSLQNSQHNKELLDERNPECQIASSTSDDEEGTIDTKYELTQQVLMYPILDNKERTTVMKSRSIDDKTPLQNKDVSTVNNATRGRDLYQSHELTKHPEMTQQWMT